jgi:hypothetical protein
MGHCTGAIADDLDLDVARSRYVLLDVEIAVAERAKRFGATRLIGQLQLFRPIHPSHASSAAASNRLEHDRLAFAARFEEIARLGKRRCVARAGQN